MSEAVLSDLPGTGRPNRRPGLRGFLVVLAILLAAGGLLVAVLMGWVLPKQYESTVVIQVVGGRVEVGDLEAKPSVEMMDAEARRVVGLSTFDRVRERLQLEKRWDADAKEVTERLRETVRAEVREGTDLIEITARHSNPSDARDVAMGLAKEYSELRREEEIRKATMALEALDAELKEQEERVEKKREELDKLLEDSDLEWEDGPESSAEVKAILRAEERSLMDVRAVAHDLDETVRSLERLRGRQLYQYAASLELPQNTASVLWTEYDVLLAELEDLREGGFGEGHPQVVEGELRLSMLKGDLERAIKRMRELAMDRRAVVDSRAEALREEYDRKASVVRSLQIEGSQYLIAKKSYWDEMAVLQILEFRHINLRQRTRNPWVVVAVGEDVAQ